MEHITINSDRSVTVPVELRKIGVQYDHNVNTIEFVGPRYSGNVDLSTMTIYINYILSDKTPGKYKAENVIIDDQDDSLIRFNWTITRNVTKVSGILSCLVCAKKTDEEGNEINHWNTDIFRLLSVSEGMENDLVIQEQYPDIITSLIQNVNEHDAKLLEFSGLDTRVTDIENNVNELKGDLAYKIDKPAIPPEVGKILKVTAVNEDGTFTCEWGDAPSGGGGAVDDVQIDGASIVQDGVANIPQIKGNNIIGVTKVVNDSGLYYQGTGALAGSIAIKEPSQRDIDGHSAESWRRKFQPITVSVLDYALKVGMCDGKAPAWTDVERIAALLRMGCTVDDNGFVKWTAQEGA